MLGLAAGGDHRVSDLRKDRDRDASNATGGASDKHLTVTWLHAVSLERFDAHGRGETRCAVDHRVARGQSFRHRQQPRGRHADVLGEAAPSVLTHVVTSDENLLPRTKFTRGALDDGASRVDARHMRKLARHARVSRGTQRVFEVQRRISDAYQHFAGGQFVESALLDRRTELPHIVFDYEVASETVVDVHKRLRSSAKQDEKLVIERHAP